MVDTQHVTPETKAFEYDLKSIYATIMEMIQEIDNHDTDRTHATETVKEHSDAK